MQVQNEQTIFTENTKYLDTQKYSHTGLHVADDNRFFFRKLFFHLEVYCSIGSYGSLGNIPILIKLDWF